MKKIDRMYKRYVKSEHDRIQEKYARLSSIITPCVLDIYFHSEEYPINPFELDFAADDVRIYLEWCIDKCDVGFGKKPTVDEFIDFETRDRQPVKLNIKDDETIREMNEWLEATTFSGFVWGTNVNEEDEKRWEKLM